MHTVLLEVQTINELKEFFRLYDNRNDVLFELTGVHVAETQSETTASRTERPETEQNRTSESDINIEDTCNLHVSAVKQCCVISFYCICFSIIN
jgi:hypothetical protein